MFKCSIAQAFHRISQIAHKNGSRFISRKKKNAIKIVIRIRKLCKRNLVDFICRWNSVDSILKCNSCRKFCEIEFFREICTKAPFFPSQIVHRLLHTLLDVLGILISIFNMKCRHIQPYYLLLCGKFWILSTFLQRSKKGSQIKRLYICHI